MNSENKTFSLLLEGYGPKAALKSQIIHLIPSFSTAQFRPTRFTIPHYVETFREYRNDRLFVKIGTDLVATPFDQLPLIQVGFTTANCATGDDVAKKVLALFNGLLGKASDSTEWADIKYDSSIGRLRFTFQPKCGLFVPADQNSSPINMKCMQTLGISPLEEIARVGVQGGLAENKSYTLDGITKMNALETLHLMASLTTSTYSNNPNLTRHCMASVCCPGVFGQQLFWENGRTHYAPFDVYMGATSLIEIWVVDQDGVIIDIPPNIKWSVELTITPLIDRD